MERGKTLSEWGAGGGHGTTTVAVVAAELASVKFQGADAWLPKWILGHESIPTNAGVITDAGRLTGSSRRTDANLVALRGPSVAGLHGLRPLIEPNDSLAILREPWRVVTNTEVSSVLGIEVEFEIPFVERVARLADAGLLGARLDHLEEFKDLSAWLDIINLHEANVA